MQFIERFILFTFVIISYASYIPPNNPPENINPNPDFFDGNYCEVSSSSLVNRKLDNSEDCTNAALEATNYARSLENVSAMILPINYLSLTAAQQLFVVANLERVDRGLPPMLGLTAEYNSKCQIGADENSNPPGPSSDAETWGTNWSGGYSSVLTSNYGWMYLDGPGGPNLDCVSSNNYAYCWGHRDHILGNYSTNGGTPLMGAAYSLNTSYITSMTELFVEYSGSTLPTLVYTWQDALHNIPPVSSGSKAKVVASLASSFVVCAIIGFVLASFFVYKRWRKQFTSALDSIQNTIRRLFTDRKTSYVSGTGAKINESA